MYFQESDLSLHRTEKKSLDSEGALEKLKYLFKNINDLPTSAEAGCSSCRNFGEAIATVQRIVKEISEELITESLDSSALFKSEVTLQTDSDVNNEEEMESLRKELQDLKQKYEIDKQNSSTLIK